MKQKQKESVSRIDVKYLLSSLFLKAVVVSLLLFLEIFIQW